MIDVLAIIATLILGAASSALWDLCKAAYRKRNDQELSLLNLFKREPIQTLSLPAPLFKKSINRTNVELKQYKKASGVGLKHSSRAPVYIQGSYHVSIPIRSTNDMDIVCLYKKG